MPFTCFILHGLLNRGQSTFELSVIRIILQALFIGIVRTDKIALAMQGSTFSSPALGPVGFQLSRLFCILQSVVPFFFGSVRRRSVTVEDVVLGLKSDGLGKAFSVKCRC